MATRQAYGLTDDVVTYATTRHAQASAQQGRPTGRQRRHPVARPDHRCPAFTSSSRGRTSTTPRPALDRPVTRSRRQPRDYVVAARNQPDRLIETSAMDQPALRYHHGNGFIASPAKPVRGTPTTPTRRRYPEFLASVSVRTARDLTGPAPIDQPRVYFGPVIPVRPLTTRSSEKDGADRNTTTRRHRDQELPYYGTGAYRSAMAGPHRVRRKCRANFFSPT